MKLAPFLQNSVQYSTVPAGKKGRGNKKGHDSLVIYIYLSQKKTLLRSLCHLLYDSSIAFLSTSLPSFEGSCECVMLQCAQIEKRERMAEMRHTTIENALSSTPTRSYKSQCHLLTLMLNMLERMQHCSHMPKFLHYIIAIQYGIPPHI